ncbi:glycosyltransferase family 2 protein [Mesorhizobium sp.]|uniref:glycosyltransferase family 2 protein n=1 Tax=Mesorhizobium sp. TaxID=1871066 RepID=UPI0025DC62AE|nr:glycosyltransferase family 2 protein [Mesorhizobium sp.]
MIIPVFNEIATLAKVLSVVSEALPGVEKEVILVDDGSVDGTREWLRRNFPEGPRSGLAVMVDAGGNLEFSTGPGHCTTVRPHYHERNSGKGAAVRNGLALATGEVIVIQDADLEYDPADWTAMYDLIARRKVADVVYGSRFYGWPHRSLYFHHYMANRFISLMFNLLYNQTLTDIECCYKMFTREVKERLRLTCDDFGCEVQLSAQIARAGGLRIYEVGISYYGRTYEEGKKINWRDGMKALWYLVRFRF